MRRRGPISRPWTRAIGARHRAAALDPAASGTSLTLTDDLNVGDDVAIDDDVIIRDGAGSSNVVRGRWASDIFAWLRENAGQIRLQSEGGYYIAVEDVYVTLAGKVRGSADDDELLIDGRVAASTLKPNVRITSSGAGGLIFNAASGVQKHLVVGCDVNQSGSAGYAMLDVYAGVVTEGSGDGNLIQARVNNDIVFSVDSDGNVFAAGDLGAAGVAQVGMLVSPLYSTSSLTGTRTLSTGTSWAFYVGRAPKAMTSATVVFKVTSAGNTFTWAEVALAKGAINPLGNPTLTMVGHADATAAFSAAASAAVTINVAGGQSIAAGDDLWVVYAKASTGSPIFRSTANGSDELGLGVITTSALRPSTNIGTANAWTADGSGNPVMTAVLVP